MDIRNVIEQIESRICSEVIEHHMNQSLQRKKLVYTSFDGDYMHFLPHMLGFTMTNGFLPINPESALGYYVSTTTHNGSKIPVMKDCIKAESICDEMWIFNPVNGHIPEGVLAEIMVWLSTKGTEIRLIPFFDKHRVVPNIEIPTDLSRFILSRTDAEMYISSRSSRDIQEINMKLFDASSKEPTSAYIVANFYNYKHIDWARAYCYKNEYCPISPQNIMPYSLYTNTSEDFEFTYMLDRLALLDRCENLLWFTNLSNFDFEVRNLDCFSCTELYYWFKYKNTGDIYVVDWKDAEVPKYASSKKWALTTVEATELIELIEIDLHSSVREKIIEYEKLIKDEFNIFKGDLLGIEECNLIKADMNAFLFGLISDQSVKAELAWSLPYRLKQRLGVFDIHEIAKMTIEELTAVIKEKPALHRYPSNIAKYLLAASNTLITEYHADASNIWSKGVSAAEIVRRLETFKGISHKKAALGSLLLVRDLGIEIDDKENINLAYDIHIRRICLRSGLSNEDSIESVTEVGKKVFPDFPGRLTSSFWAIGRDICRPSNPLCEQCPLDEMCAHNTSLGGDIHA